MVKMQAENKKSNIKTLSFGCRLNALESENIKHMLAPVIDTAIVVNTCAVTAEAERQSGQSVRKLSRENPNAPIFITGCAATRNPDLFYKIPNAMVIANRDKMRLGAYIDALNCAPCHFDTPRIDHFYHQTPRLSKQFIQVQNGCNHACTYCITRILRGRSESFAYSDILRNTCNATNNGFGEIVLTGIDIASYARDGMLISDICANLLRDVPGLRRLRLSSMDPASPEIFKIIELIHRDNRMMPHIHLSMQSGSDEILRQMGRRHNSETIRKIVNFAGSDITFSWDIICGFPGETDANFRETMDLVAATRPIKIHAFPFSPRPSTVAANMTNQVARHIAKQRVKTISEAADKIRNAFMQSQIGKTTQVLVEENNIARTPDDISVRIDGARIPGRTICNVKLTKILNQDFIGIII